MAKQDTVDQLIDQLADYRTRSQARQELKKHREAAADKLLEVVRDSDRNVNQRWAAITLLSQYKYEPATEDLLDVLRNEMNLRGPASEALKHITGQDIGEDADAWERALHGEQEPAEPPEQSQAEQPETAAGGETRTDAATVKDHDQLQRQGFAMVKDALGREAVQLEWEDEGYVYLRLNVADDRKQQMLISFEYEPASGQNIVEIYTECGKPKSDVTDTIDRRNVTIRYGQFEQLSDAEGGLQIVMRCRVPISDLNAGSLRDIVRTMAGDADNLEFELTQADRI